MPENKWKMLAICLSFTANELQHNKKSEKKLRICLKWTNYVLEAIKIKVTKKVGTTKKKTLNKYK